MKLCLSLISYSFQCVELHTRSAWFKRDNKWKRIHNMPMNLKRCIAVLQGREHLPIQTIFAERWTIEWTHISWFSTVAQRSNCNRHNKGSQNQLNVVDRIYKLIIASYQLSVHESTWATPNSVKNTELHRNRLETKVVKAEFKFALSVPRVNL